MSSVVKFQLGLGIYTVRVLNVYSCKHLIKMHTCIHEVTPNSETTPRTRNPRTMHTHTRTHIRTTECADRHPHSVRMQQIDNAPRRPCPTPTTPHPTKIGEPIKLCSRDTIANRQMYALN